MDERLTAEWLIPQLNQAQLRFYHLFSAPASTVGYHTYPLAPCDILSILRLDGTESQRYASRFFSAFLSFRRKPESSFFSMFWMPDQVRHDELGLFMKSSTLTHKANLPIPHL